ncbi:Xaa-Pro peptidase family protein [soil metagenome]
MRASTIPADRYEQRLEHAREALRDRGGAALLIGVGADLRWLTGYAALPLERLTMLVVPAEGETTLIVPRLERAAAGHAPTVSAGLIPVRTWEETDDPFLLAAELARGLGNGGSSSGGSSPEGRPFLVSDRLWASFLLRLQEALPGAAFGVASTVLRELRMVKDAEEVGLLRQAAHAADRVVAAVARGSLVGRTEADVAREVRTRLVEEGHDEAAFWIVASGSNSASPHHDPGERRIQAGQPIVLDIGGTIQGYGSDITRTVWGTGADGAEAPGDEYRRLYAVLQEAQAEATRAVRPEASCESIDRVARDSITAAGFGPNFIHRTGHGIGLEGHEDPYLVAGNGELLREGHAFSVEPGIYLDGRYGARIEDIVVCGRDGPDVLNEAPRDLLVVAG